MTNGRTPARPIKMGDQGGCKYFVPDHMGFKSRWTSWVTGEDHTGSKDDVFRRTNRKRQRSYNKWLCDNYEFE